MLGYVLPGVLYIVTYETEAKIAWNNLMNCFNPCFCSRYSGSGSDGLISSTGNRNSSGNFSAISSSPSRENKNESESINENETEIDVENALHNSESNQNQNRKTRHEIVQSIVPFLMPCFMIFFGFSSMIIGVSSIFLF